MSGKGGFFKHLGAYLPANIAAGLAGFASVYVFTRALSPEAYGQYALILTSLNFAHLWLYTATEAGAARGLATGYGTAHADNLKSNLVATAGFGLLALVLCTIGLVLIPLPPQIALAIGFGLIALILRAFLRLSLERWRALGEVQRFTLIDSLHTLCGIGLGAVLAVFTPLGLAGPFAGLAIASGVALLADAPALWEASRSGRFRASLALRDLRFGYGIVFALALEQVLTVADRFMIAGLVSPAAAGAYAAAFALSGRIMDLFFMWSGKATGVMATNAFEREGAEAAAQVMRRFAATIAYLGLPACVGLGLVAQPLAELMVAPALRPQVASLLPYLAAAGLLSGLATYYFGEPFRLARRTGRFVSLLAAGACLTLGTTFALIHSFGLMGAAFGTIVGLAVTCALLHWQGRRLLMVRLPFGAWARALAGCLIMTLALHHLPITQGLAALAIKSLVGGLVYGVTVWALMGAPVPRLPRFASPKSPRTA